MTFNEWAEANEQQLHDDTFNYQDIWDAAQANYPFAICDNALEREMINDVIENYELSIEEANEFVDEYGTAIVDDMWSEYSNSMHYNIDNYERAINETNN